MSQYIHGTHQDEQKRLANLNKLLNQRCLDKLDLSGTERVLDIGSGLGIFSRQLAHRLPEGKVVGIERSEDQLAAGLQLAQEEGEIDLVLFREGSAYALPLPEEEWESYDIVFIRFLLEHLNKPALALEQAYKALRPGGRVFLIDDDHANFHIAPPVGGFEILWPAYCKVYQMAGNDPYVGRRLVTLLKQAGFKNTAIDFILFGAAYDEHDFQLYAENLIGIIDQARPEIRKLLQIDDPAFDGLLGEITNWASQDHAALWYAANWAQAIK